ncbi:hypothetical protein SKAU_G00118130 [Synaphobranchus kaupii]|uniref:Uncharacterized protein n=1 Tax=Synaphobranchus kaupii TaxID=118154 RepID=A0A9Q1FNU3_SYNKA|nr:hypothetical protein SKAU_G00118130 [Synaphobranchus kaupii]
MWQHTSANSVGALQLLSVVVTVDHAPSSVLNVTSTHTLDMSSVLHNRDAMTAGFFQPLPPTACVVDKTLSHCVRLVPALQSQLQDLESMKAQLAVTESQLEDWVNDVKDWAEAATTTPNDADADALASRIEVLVASIKKRSQRLYKDTDGNKGRGRISRKIREEKRILTSVVEKYNRMVPSTETLCLETILSGETAWSWQLPHSDSVDLRTKRRAFDIITAIRRLEEEKKIVVAEMDHHWKSVSTRADTLKEPSCLFSTGHSQKTDPPFNAPDVPDTNREVAFAPETVVHLVPALQSQLQDLESMKAQLAVTESQLEDWVNDVKDWAEAATTTPNDADADALASRIEVLVASIKKRSQRLYKDTDGNKGRGRISRKIREEKRILTSVVEKYNRMVPSTETLCLETILSGETAWSWQLPHSGMYTS